MHKFAIILLLSLPQIVFGQVSPAELSERDFVLGKTLSMKSSILNETRELNVYLPLSYNNENTKHYPVVYLLDGSKDEDFIHVSGIVQFASFPWIKMLPETIVIGIANVDRKRDFTYPSNNLLDQKEFPTSGKSKAFISFIEKELQPLVNSKYRTTDTKTIIGQSLGGLLATEVLFNHTELFDNYIIVSPSLWWDDENLLEQTLKMPVENKGIYIAGGKEGEVMERTAKALFTKLQSNQSGKPRLFYEFLEDKSHGDALHVAVYRGFEKLFAGNAK